jgi:hypothetical protein
LYVVYAKLVSAPGTNVLAEAEVMEIVPTPVPAVVVKFVGLALLKAVLPVAAHAKVPPLKVMFFAPIGLVPLEAVRKLPVDVYV